MIFQGHKDKNNKRLGLFLVSVIGYIIQLFCLCCVAWQSYVCMDKYISQPTATSVIYVPNEGKYLAAVTFCKRLSYSDVTAKSRLEDLVIKDLLMIEAEYDGYEGWSPIYQNGRFNEHVAIPTRKFTSFVWSDDIFKLCVSLQLGNEKTTMSQLEITYQWTLYSKLPTNLQVYVHGWGSFEMDKNEIPLIDPFQVFQLNQETLQSLSIHTMACSAYENSMLDECLETKAVQYANNTIGCINYLMR